MEHHLGPRRLISFPSKVGPDFSQQYSGWTCSIHPSHDLAYLLLCFTFDVQIIPTSHGLKTTGWYYEMMVYTYIIRKTETKEEISVSVSALQ